jgi:hypothetical protein
VADSQTTHRRELVIIVAPIRGVDSFHFTSTKLQPGDIWFPVGDSLFVSVEQAMQTNGIAHNVTRVSEINESGPSRDYRVTYNVYQGKPLFPKASLSI